MKRLIFAMVVLASLLAVPVINAKAVTVSIAEEHVSIEVPSGWTVQRNYTSGGIIYDLHMEGPANGGLMPPIAFLDGKPWPGVVSDETLYAEMKSEIHSLETEPDVTSVIIVSAPTNMTLNGEKANDCTMRVTISGVEMRGREVIVADGDWNRVWFFIVMDDNSDWVLVASAVQQMVNSLTIEETGSPGNGVALMAGVVLAVVVIVVVVVVLLMQKRKRQQATMVQPPFAPYRQVPPPSN